MTARGIILTEHDVAELNRLIESRTAFDRHDLEACPQPLAVSTLPGITWCDLGSPERVVDVLTRLGLSTSRLATYTA